MAERVQRFSVKQGDTAPLLYVGLEHDSDTPIDLTGATVEFHMKNRDTGVVKVDAAGAVDSVEDVVVRYDWAVGDTDTVGWFEFEFEVTYADGRQETFPNTGNDLLQVKPQIA